MVAEDRRCAGWRGDYLPAQRLRVAVATGMTSPIWPTEKTTAKLVVLSVESR